MAEVMSRASYTEVLVKAGRLEEAERELAEAAQAARLFDGMFDAPLALRRGELRRRQWRLDEARDSYREALRTRASSPAESKNDDFDLEVLAELEQIELLSGRVEDALLLNDQSLALLRSRGDRALEIIALRRRGLLLFDGMRLEAALATLTQALEIAQQEGRTGGQALLHYDLGFVALACHCLSVA
jgi:tetratricopeptide (TPR) repeat protein